MMDDGTDVSARGYTLNDNDAATRRRTPVANVPRNVKLRRRTRATRVGGAGTPRVYRFARSFRIVGIISPLT